MEKESDETMTSKVTPVVDTAKERSVTGRTTVTDRNNNAKEQKPSR